MIIVRILGGLGNQLFQYAAARAVAHRLQMPLYLDLRWISPEDEHLYALHNFNISAAIAPPWLSMWYTLDFLPPLGQKIYGKLLSVRPKYQCRLCSRSSLDYDSNVHNIRQSTYLRSWFQSEKFFADISKLLRQELTLRTEISEENREIASMIQSNPTAVALHIRRGDYLTLQHIFPICSIEYYKAAIAHLVQNISSPHFYIFSNDPAWCRENLQISYPVTFVSRENTEPQKDFEELWLMSLCKHHIIANSTFSWWGAWLATYPDQVVIAPKRWVASGNPDNTTLIPERWHILDG